VLHELAERDGRSHRPGGDESSEDSLAEAGVGSPGEELEESHEQVLIKVLALRVLLVLLLDSASFIQVDSLNNIEMVSHNSHHARRYVARLSAHITNCHNHIPFFLLLIFVLNNKSKNFEHKHSLILDIVAIVSTFHCLNYQFLPQSEKTTLSISDTPISLISPN